MKSTSSTLRTVVVVLAALWIATPEVRAQKIGQVGALKGHQWQHGVWRDAQLLSATGYMSFPSGPILLTIPYGTETQVIVIDGDDDVRYVARWGRRFTNIIINDPIDFVVEGSHLFVRGLKRGQAFKLDLVIRERLAP